MGKDQFGIQKVMRGSDYFADSMGQFALMTLEDKIKLCSGANFWESESMEQYGIPSFFMSDGPYGLRTEKGEWIILESTRVSSQPVSRQRLPVQRPRRRVHGDLLCGE